MILVREVDGAGSGDVLRGRTVTAVTAGAPWRTAETGNYLLVQPWLRKELTRVGDTFRVKLLCVFPGTPYLCGGCTFPCSS